MLGCELAVLQAPIFEGLSLVLSQTFDVPSARDMSALSESWREAFGVIEFKGVHYPKSVILHAVFFYLRYAVSYRKRCADHTVTA